MFSKIRLFISCQITHGVVSQYPKPEAHDKSVWSTVEITIEWGSRNQIISRDDNLLKELKKGEIGRPWIPS